MTNIAVDCSGQFDMLTVAVADDESKTCVSHVQRKYFM